MTTINIAKLNQHNRVFIHPVCAEQDGTHTVNEGWRFLGYCQAPYAGCGKDAAVYELIDRPSFGFDDYGEFEFGIYWGHCTRKDFIISNIKDNVTT